MITFCPFFCSAVLSSAPLSCGIISHYANFTFSLKVLLHSITYIDLVDLLEENTEAERFKTDCGLPWGMPEDLLLLCSNRIRDESGVSSQSPISVNSYAYVKSHLTLHKRLGTCGRWWWMTVHQHLSEGNLLKHTKMCSKIGYGCWSKREDLLKKMW